VCGGGRASQVGHAPLGAEPAQIGGGAQAGKEGTLHGAPPHSMTHLKRPRGRPLQLRRDADAPLIGHGTRGKAGVAESSSGVLREKSVASGRADAKWSRGGAVQPPSLFHIIIVRAGPRAHTHDAAPPRHAHTMTTTTPMDTEAVSTPTPITTTPSAPAVPSAVVVHPLVLLSIVDHYHRVARDTRKRVVGCLLGEVSRGRVDVTNSFAGEEEEEAERRRKTNGDKRARSIALSTFISPPLPPLSPPSPSPVPFEEDEKDPKIWFLDHSYLESMYAMFKKVNGERSARKTKEDKKKMLRRRAHCYLAFGHRDARGPAWPHACTCT